MQGLSNMIRKLWHGETSQNGLLEMQNSFAQPALHHRDQRQCALGLELSKDVRTPLGSPCTGMPQCQYLSASQSALVLVQWSVSAGAGHTLFMALACDSRHRWAAGADWERLLMPKESRAAALCQQPSSAKLCHRVLQLFPGRGTAQNTQHL